MIERRILESRLNAIRIPVGGDSLRWAKVWDSADHQVSLTCASSGRGEILHPPLLFHRRHSYLTICAATVDFAVLDTIGFPIDAARLP